MDVNQIKRKTLAHGISILLRCGVLMALGLSTFEVTAGTLKGMGANAKVTSIKGTYTFGGKKSNWSAKLTPTGDGTYEAAYESTWNGRAVKYAGTIKTDRKTEISGTGKASGGGANGNFEFSGKYGKDGIAQCNYKEINGGRSGPMTAELPK